MIIETCPECGHDLVHIELMCDPPIPEKRCYKCGWSWRGNPEPIERVPFNPERYNEKINEY